VGAAEVVGPAEVVNPFEVVGPFEVDLQHIRRPKMAGKVLPTHSASVASHHIAPPSDSAELRLVVVSIDKMVAT